MSIYLSSFIIGFTAAALPGAVQTSLLQSAVLGNHKKVFKFAFGAAIMDGLFLLLAYFGLIQFVGYFYWLKVLITLLGVFYIGYLGLSGIYKFYKKIEENKELKSLGFWNGILIVLLHPPTIFYFIGVSAILFVEVVGTLPVVLGSLVLSLGAITCFTVVVLIGYFIRKTGNDKVIRLINLLASLVLIFFAVKLLFSLF